MSKRIRITIPSDDADAPPEKRRATPRTPPRTPSSPLEDSLPLSSSGKRKRSLFLPELPSSSTPASTASHHPSFESLPYELVAQILSQIIPVQELLRCTETCKTWRRIILSYPSVWAKTDFGLRTSSWVYRQPSDIPLAKTVYSMAARVGNAEAQCILSYQLRTSDPQHAMTLAREAAASGIPKAQTDLGVLLIKEKMYEEAVYWLKLAAIEGFPDAVNNVGCCYYSGLGVKVDKTLSLEFFRAAAEMGCLFAYRNIGNWYLVGGGGVPRNVVMARVWLTLASKSSQKGFTSYAAQERPPMSSVLASLPNTDRGGQSLERHMLGVASKHGVAPLLGILPTGETDETNEEVAALAFEGHEGEEELKDSPTTPTTPFAGVVH